jgi:putative flavoprotein involved in K+ transport
VANAGNGRFDVIVVGAGQAGLGVGYYLKRDGRRFVVLERGRIGETWRSQRWNSFELNTPNWSNVLPGDTYDGAEPDGFWHRDELVGSFERYATKFDLPIRTGVTVTAVEASASGDGFVVCTDDPDIEELEARTVVLASGLLQMPNIPALSTKIPKPTVQLHTADYRSPDTLPPGAVVVVGGGQSGCQIVEDLLPSGRPVYLCTSKVARLPRRYRGREILEWWADMGFLDVAVDDLEDPSVRFATQPQISGLGRHGHTVSLQQLERDGATLLGRLIDVEDVVLITDDRLAEYISFADEKSAKFKQNIDAYLQRVGIDPPPLEDDPADLPAAPGAGRGAPTRLDLREANVAAIIWCTGFTADFSWIRLPVVDDDGRPMHERGVAPVPGIYFLGFPWLHSRKSGIIYGIEEDSRHVASAIAGRLD